MRAGEASGAEDAEGSSVGTSQKFCSDRRRGRGAEVGEVVGGDGQAGRSGFGVEQQVGGLHAAFGEKAVARIVFRTIPRMIPSMIPGMIQNDDELDSERVAGCVVTGHGEEGSVGKLSLRAIRNDDGGVAVAEGRLDGGDELSGIEEAGDVSFGEMSVGHGL